MDFSVIMVIAMVGIFAAAIVGSIALQKANVAAMKRLAGELGYEFMDRAPVGTADMHPLVAQLVSAFGSWRIEGREGDSSVRIYTITRGSGKSRSTYTVVEASAPQTVQGRFSIAREGFFSKIGKAVFKTQDIQAGDEAFDKAVIVKGDDESAIQGLLSSSTFRDAVLRAIAAYPALLVSNGSIHFERQGLIKTPDFYRPLITSMTEISRAMKK